MGQTRTRRMLNSNPNFLFEVYHMRLVHLLIAAGAGTLGPERVFPLPPASVKPLFITRHGQEKKEICIAVSYAVITFHYYNSNLGRKRTNKRRGWMYDNHNILTWHKRISNVIA